MTDNRELVFFPQPMIDLQQELIHHPELVDLLQKHPAQELELRLAEIASYCQVLLDGAYTGEDLVKLCGILTKKLQEKRTGILIIGGNVQ